MREVRDIAAACCCCGFLSPPAQHTKTGCCMSAACRLGKYYCGGDQLARLVHRGVGDPPRVIVQHARVVVGATRYYDNTMVPCIYYSIAAVLLAVLCGA